MIKPQTKTGQHTYNQHGNTPTAKTQRTIDLYSYYLYLCFK
jgi:hypothetical protein